MRQQTARDQNAAGATASPKRGRKPRQVVQPGHETPRKVDARGDGDLLDALKSLKNLASTHGVAKVHDLVDLLG